MNLYDIVRRTDPSILVHGYAQASEPLLGNERVRAVSLNAGTRIVVMDAQRITCLRDFPTLIGWKVAGEIGGQIDIHLSSGGRAATIARQQNAEAGQTDIKLDWPVWVGSAPFDLTIEAIGNGPIMIVIGPLFDPRQKIRSLIEGRGIEVGPGIRPLILPSEKVDVEYVEEKAPEEWMATYTKKEVALDHLTPAVMARYRVGSALTLAEWEDESLDFIFSNHVFEHLMNPIQVLKNWLRKLKSGGCVVGVIPDARFTFDLRQPLTHPVEFEREATADNFEIPFEKYERWCRYTAPYATPESLKARRYSVHMHYYTPAVFLSLCQLVTESEFPPLFLNCAPNNKDFGFVLQKARIA